MSFRNIFSIIALAVLALAVFLYFFGDPSKEVIQPTVDNELGSELEPDDIGFTGEATNSNEALEVGEIGEIISENNETGEEEPLVLPDLPLNIFSTTAIILEIGSDFLVVQGKGDNFADGKPRELTSFFDENSLTFTKDMVKYKGLDGLNILSRDMEVKIGSRENIRGKIEFTIKTIIILN